MHLGRQVLQQERHARLDDRRLGEVVVVKNTWSSVMVTLSSLMRSDRLSSICPWFEPS
jgi:hypothetical protein